MKKIAVDTPQPALVEPRYKVNYQMIEQILTLDPTHPEYPSKHPFEAYYAASGGTPEIYPRKHAVAVALISDPQDRYKNIRFLVEKFILKGTEVTPEIKALKDDLKSRVREALLKRADKKKQEFGNTFQRQ